MSHSVTAVVTAGTGLVVCVVFGRHVCLVACIRRVALLCGLLTPAGATGCCWLAHHPVCPINQLPCRSAALPHSDDDVRSHPLSHTTRMCLGTRTATTMCLAPAQGTTRMCLGDLTAAQRRCVFAQPLSDDVRSLSRSATMCARSAAQRRCALAQPLSDDVRSLSRSATMGVRTAAQRCSAFAPARLRNVDHITLPPSPPPRSPAAGT
jgi:hypothetical protein